METNAQQSHTAHWMSLCPQLEGGKKEGPELLIFGEGLETGKVGRGVESRGGPFFREPLSPWLQVTAIPGRTWESPGSLRHQAGKTPVVYLSVKVTEKLQNELGKHASPRYTAW